MTYEDLRQAALAFRRKHGQKRLDEVFASFGVDGFGIEDVPENRWPELMAALQTDGTTVAGLLAEIGRNAFAKRAKR